MNIFPARSLAARAKVTLAVAVASGCIFDQVNRLSWKRCYRIFLPSFIVVVAQWLHAFTKVVMGKRRSWKRTQDQTLNWRRKQDSKL
jgi:hypothetical protein